MHRLTHDAQRRAISTSSTLLAGRISLEQSQDPGTQAEDVGFVNRRITPADLEGARVVDDATGSTEDGMYFLAALLFGAAALTVVVPFALVDLIH